MELETLVAPTTKRLDDLINDYISKGWKLDGTWQCISSQYYQRMVKGDYRSAKRSKDDN